MGWKGTVRSLNSSIKAVQRENARINREHDKQRKIEQKNQELRSARNEHAEHVEYCKTLVSLHCECSEAVNWNEISNSQEPLQPRFSKKNEKNALENKSNYKPGLLDKIFKLTGKKIKTLQHNIIEAIEKDTLLHEKKINEWSSKKQEWLSEVNLANQIIEGSPEAKLKVIEESNPFSSISQLGSELSFSISEGSILSSTVNIHGKEIIPPESKSLLQSGKVSTKKMPKSKYYEIFQDHVCSVVLRIANEVFALLPEKIIIVNVVDDLLNTKTGHLEELPILSVAISRETLNKINLQKVDPSDCMDNFVHNMSFKKLKGFDAITALNPKEFNI